MTPPVTPGDGNSVAVRGNKVVVAGYDNDQLVVATSNDQGKSWSKKQAPAAALFPQTSSADIAVAPGNGGLVVGPPSESSIGVQDPATTAYIDTGKGLHQVKMPGQAKSAGWAGQYLVMPGDGTNCRLFSSADGGTHWTDLTKSLLVIEPPDHDIPLEEPRFSDVLSLSDGSAVLLAVTTQEGVGITAEVWHAGADGSFTRVASVAFSADVGGGPFPLVFSTYGDAAIIVAAPGETSFQVVTLAGQVTSIVANGLPVSPDSISFQDASNGLAQVTVRGCMDGKSGCYSDTGTYVTSDGGHTWNPAT